MQAVSKTRMTYTIAVCAVTNSWWWTEKLSETCRVLFQNKFEKLVHLVGFITRIFKRNSLTKQSVVQEIPDLLRNPNIYHIHKTRQSPRLFVTLRNTHTKRSVGLSPPSSKDHNLWNVQGCFFSAYSKLTFQVCAVSLWLCNVWVLTYLSMEYSGGDGWLKITSSFVKKTPAIQVQSRSNGR